MAIVCSLKNIPIPGILVNALDNPANILSPKSPFSSLTCKIFLQLAIPVTKSVTMNIPSMIHPTIGTPAIAVVTAPLAAPLVPFLIASSVISLATFSACSLASFSIDSLDKASLLSFITFLNCLDENIFWNTPDTHSLAFFINLSFIDPAASFSNFLLILSVIILPALVSFTLSHIKSFNLLYLPEIPLVTLDNALPTLLSLILLTILVILLLFADSIASPAIVVALLVEAELAIFLIFSNSLGSSIDSNIASTDSPAFILSG